MWSNLVKRCRDVLALQRTSAPADTAASEPARTTSRDARSEIAAARRRHRPSDDLTVIKGIGPVMRDRLRILGIATFADLAEADPGELARRLRRHQPISDDYIRSWVQAARDRLGG